MLPDPEAPNLIAQGREIIAAMTEGPWTGAGKSMAWIMDNDDEYFMPYETAVWLRNHAAELLDLAERAEALADSEQTWIDTACEYRNRAAAAETEVARLVGVLTEAEYWDAKSAAFHGHIGLREFIHAALSSGGTEG